MRRLGWLCTFVLVTILLAACAGPPPAPVEDRSQGRGAYEPTPDGSYRVKRGDSLYTIAFRFGLDWREIARLNNISSPYVIHPDQMLRLSASSSAAQPPGAQSNTASATSGQGVQISGVPATPASTTKAVAEPSSRSVTVAESTGSNPPLATSSATVEAPAEPVSDVEASSSTIAARGTQAPAGTSYTVPAGDPDRWIWPTEGRLLSSFNASDSSRKGIDIAGTKGQSVVASADGQVVYSGSGLIGYGELIIIKHSDRMLSAYAHNSRRLVNEGQQVTAGSKIAEMGTNDRNQEVLHFEIRVNGVPQNPVQYLPRR